MKEQSKRDRAITNVIFVLMAILCIVLIFNAKTNDTTNLVIDEAYYDACEIKDSLYNEYLNEEDEKLIEIKYKEYLDQEQRVNNLKSLR